MVLFINKTKIKIEYSLFLMLAFSLLLKNDKIPYVILFSALHELGHIFTLLFCRGKLDELVISFYGIGLRHSHNFCFINELIFLLSGVAVNFIFYLLGIQREINFALFIINILPLYPLDGGRALKLIFDRALPVTISDCAFRAFTALFIVLLILLSFLLKNISLLFISVYIIVFSVKNEVT